MQPGKTLWLLTIHPELPDFISASIQFMIIFQKIFSLTILGKFIIFHLIFIIMYILVNCIDLGYAFFLYMKSVKIKVFFHT